MNIRNSQRTSSLSRTKQVARVLALIPIAIMILSAAGLPRSELPTQTGPRGRSRLTSLGKNDLSAHASQLLVCGSPFLVLYLSRLLTLCLLSTRDYAMYVVEAVGAREGPSTRADGTAIQDSLELAVLVPGSNIPEVSFEAAVSDPMPFTYALGYSYKDDPNFHHCGKELSLRNGGLFLDNCLLSGGASGGPWIQGNAQDHKLISVNSWGYSDGVTPGMGAPRLDNIMGGHASDVFALAKCAAFSSAGSANGVIWCEDGADSTADEGTCTDNVGAVGGICNPGPTPSPTSAPTLDLEGCVEKTLQNNSPWHDIDGPRYSCAWYGSGSRCNSYGDSYANEGLTANMACCVCGGGDYPDEPTGQALRVMVPLYIYPQTQLSTNGETLTCTDPDWLAVADGGAQVMAIINPDSGPVASDHASYSAQLACAQVCHVCNPD